MISLVGWGDLVVVRIFRWRIVQEKKIYIVAWYFINNLKGRKEEKKSQGRLIKAKIFFFWKVLTNFTNDQFLKKIINIRAISL